MNETKQNKLSGERRKEGKDTRKQTGLFYFFTSIPQMRRLNMLRLLIYQQ